MGTLAEIEQATKLYADNRELLNLRVSNLNDEIEAIKRQHIQGIKAAAADTANAKESLTALIDDSRHLFVKRNDIGQRGAERAGCALPLVLRQRRERRPPDRYRVPEAARAR